MILGNRQEQMTVDEMKFRLDEISAQQAVLSKEANELAYALANTQQATEPRDVQTCPDRMTNAGPWERKEGLDSWKKFGSDRCCSFCGSAHPDELDVMLDLETTKIDVSDKRYKIYIRRPGVMNASGGAIKFYTWHLPEDPVAATVLLDKINRVAKKTLEGLLGD